MALSDLLNSMLWRARIAMRLPGIQTFAGHGTADANYRPRRLPYVSVVGPLNLEVEPDRDLPANAFLFAQTPGYLAGQDAQIGQAVPGPGQLHLTLDEITQIAVPIDFGPDVGAALDHGIARRIARVATAAIMAAVDGGAATEEGQVVVDPARLGELRRTSLRWEEGRSRFLIVSGRRLVIDQAARVATTPPSAVSIRPGPQEMADALGLRGDGSLNVPGRIARHRMSQPTAVGVDLRLDLWAASQQGLADMLERWAVLTPTRGQLLTTPGMLRQDIARGVTTITLQPGMWPTERWTLGLFDGATNFDNRLNGRQVTLSGAAVVPNGGGLAFANADTAEHLIWDAPALPPPDRPDHPAPQGYALMVEVRTIGQMVAGETLRIATLATDTGTALSVTATARLRNAVTEVVVQLRADQDPGSFAPRDFLMTPAQLADRVMLHVVLDAASGEMNAFADGMPLPPDDAVVPAAPVPALPLAMEDMVLTFGDAGGIDRPMAIRRAELLGRPLGPMDPRLAETSAGGTRWQVGDPVGVVSNYDGRTANEPFTAIVIGIVGDQLLLDRPVPRDYGRARSVVFKRALFFAQRQWRRRDDLMNRMFRLSAEYRISAFLEDRLPSNTAPIVERPVVDVHDLSPLLAEIAAAEAGEPPPPPPLGPPHERPGVRSRILNVAMPRLSPDAAEAIETTTDPETATDVTEAAEA